MTIQDVHDAWGSARAIADLCGIPTRQVLAWLASKVISHVRIQGQDCVSLNEVARSMGEGQHDPAA